MALPEQHTVALSASLDAELLKQPTPKKQTTVDPVDIQFVASPFGLLQAVNVAVKRVQANSGGRKYILWMVPRAVVTHVRCPPDRPRILDCTALCEAGRDSSGYTQQVSADCHCRIGYR